MQNYLSLRLIRLKRSEDWPVAPGRFWFVLPKGGGGRYVGESVAHKLSPGDVLAINAGSEGRICAATGGELAFWSFSLCLENMLPLFASNELSLLSKVVEDFKGAKLYAASTPLAVECHRLMLDVPPQVDLGHRSQLLRIVATVLSLELKQVHQQAGFVRVEDHLVQVFEHLSAEELLNLSVGELAARFGVSRRHLNRLFHQYFGFAVATLRMEMRLLKAVSLLRDPNAKVIRVAEQCGFNHLGLFNTCFKRRFGSSPGQWRRTIGQTGEKAFVSADGNRTCPMQFKGLCPWLGNNSGATASPETQRGARNDRLGEAAGPGVFPLPAGIASGPPNGTAKREAA